ncbi:MAG: hypothetical protein ACPL1G_00260 [Thermodesulfovibrionales bacterium]
MSTRNNLKTLFRIIFTISLFFFLINETFAERFFEKQNSWYEPIPVNPIIAPNSSAHINDILINGNSLSLVYRNFSYPIWYAKSDTPITTVAMSNPNGVCGSNAIANGWNKVPIPANAKSSGMDELCAGNYRDGHMAIISYDGKWIWDFYRARNCGSGWIADCVRKRARTIEASNEGNFVGDGSGVTEPHDNKGGVRACMASSLLHGAITYNEYLNGEIDHALAFAYYAEKKVPGGYTTKHPCTTDREGVSTREGAMYIGQRLQLNPSYNCTQHSNKLTKMICEALKKYGAIFVDNAGVGYNQFYLEDIEGKTDFWSGIIENPLPIPISHMRVIEPVCNDCTICPNCVESSNQTDTVPPAAPVIIKIE